MCCLPHFPRVPRARPRGNVVRTEHGTMPLRAFLLCLLSLRLWESGVENNVPVAHRLRAYVFSVSLVSNSTVRKSMELVSNPQLHSIVSRL